MYVRAQMTSTTNTPVAALLVFCGDPEVTKLQLFPEQQLFTKLKVHPDCEEGHGGVSFLVMSHVSPSAPHLL